MSLEKNLSLGKGIDPSKRQIYEAAMKYCYDKNLLFNVLETRRSYERQCLLYTQGRTKEDVMKAKLTQKQLRDVLALYEVGKNLQGPRVTNTLNSKHITGFAMDIRPINCAHSDIEEAMMHFNITHPIPWDPAHFELVNARSPEPLIQPTPEARAKGFARRIEGTQEPVKTRLIDRLKQTSLWELIVRYL